jgi:hypothetical protein
MLMTGKHERRALRIIVWGGRAVGGILIAFAIVNSLQIGAVTRIGGSVKLLSSLALGLLGIAWIVVLELFLRFFDKFLSGN